MADHLQIIDKTIDETGVHLTVKDKRDGSLHIEGHCLSKKDLGNRTLLKERPIYSMPKEA